MMLRLPYLSDVPTMRSGKMMSTKESPKEFTDGLLPGKWEGEKTDISWENTQLLNIQGTWRL